MKLGHFGRPQKWTEISFQTFLNSPFFQIFEFFFENEKGIVSINDRLPNGWTALHFAVEENKIKMARFIIDYGAEIEGISIEKFLTRTVGFQASF